MAETKTLDDVCANQETIIEALEGLASKIDAVSATLNQNMSYIGSGGVVNTGVSNPESWPVVAPWPPEAETEGENEETNDSTD